VQCRKLTQLKANGLLDRHQEHQEDYRTARLRQLLERLPPSDRRLIEQRFYHNVHFNEIGAEEGITKQGVQQRQADIIARLRRCWAYGGTLMSKKNWMQAIKIKRPGICTGVKFGGATCPPGSKQYGLAKTFRKAAKGRKK